MLKRIAIIFGVVMLIAGILGYIPGVTRFNADDDTGLLLGIFAVDNVHNLVHIATGVVAVVCGFISESASRNYFKVFGIVYALVALLGIFHANAPLLGIMAHNVADVALHIAIAALALYLGFGHLAERLEHRRHTHHPA